jgi:transposase-like protein
MRQHGFPIKVTIDKSGASRTALQALQEETGYKIEISQSKYLNNLIELRPSGHQAHYSTDARLQILSFGRNHFTKRRADA